MIDKSHAPWRNLHVERQASGGIERAEFDIRLKAWLIDYMLSIMGAVALVGVGSLLSDYLSLAALSFAALLGVGVTYFFNHLALGTLTGQSVGKMIMAIKVVSADGRPLNWQRLLGRVTVGYFVSAVPAGWGFISALWDSEQKAWHDKLFLTSVVKVK